VGAEEWWAGLWRGLWGFQGEMGLEVVWAEKMKAFWFFIRKKLIVNLITFWAKNVRVT